MHGMCLSNRVKLLKAGISKLEAITELTFLLASVIDVKVTKTNISFLGVLNSYWYNGPAFYSYST